MMKTANRLMVTAAAAAMTILPVAAQANTRAGDSGSVYSVGASAPGLGRAAKGEKLEGSTGIILGVFAIAAIIGGVVLASDSKDDGQSPGT